jgi:hypothetical protein
VYTEWLNISGLNGPRDTPPPLLGSSMVYYVAGGFMVLFGGLAPWGATDYTWVGVPGPAFGYSTVPGLTWVNITSLLPVHPSPRYDASMTYDAGSGDVLLFGGEYAGGNQTFNDTWTFSGSLLSPAWARLVTPRAPSPRDGAGLTYDARDHYDVLFGGYDDPTFYDDTWTFSGGVWTQLHPTPSPYYRADAGFVYDAAAAAAVLTAGLGGSTDLWAFAGGEWFLSSTGSPMGARAEASVADDSSSGNLTLFGGYNTTTITDYADTWNLSATLGIWQTLPAIGPSSRNGAAMAFDQSNGYLVLFGGGTIAGAWDNDTWILGSWPGDDMPFGVTITATPPSSQPPIAAPGNVTFLATTVGPSQNIEFNWSFGDGGTAKEVSNGWQNQAHLYTGPGTFVVTVQVNTTLGGTDEVYSWVSLNYTVGSQVVANWIPSRDTYSFGNPPNPFDGGNCYGISSSEVLYWQNEITGNLSAPYLPRPVPGSAYLVPGGNSVASGLINNTTLGVLLHQVFDPNAGATQGEFSPSTFAASYASIAGLLRQNQPALLGLGWNDLHAVIVYGQQVWPNGTVELAISDPDDTQWTEEAWYVPSASTFYYADGVAVWHAFSVIGNSGWADVAQGSWFYGLSLGIANVNPGNWLGLQAFEEQLNGYLLIADIDPGVMVNADGASDFFTAPGNSQTLADQILNSSGIEEGSVQVYTAPYALNPFGNPTDSWVASPFGSGASPAGTDVAVDPSTHPAASQTPGGVLEMWGSRIDGTPAVRGGFVNFSAATGSAGIAVAPNGDGIAVHSQGSPAVINLTLFQASSENTSFAASDLDLPANALTEFDVQNWSALNATGGTSSVNVTVTLDNGTGSSTSYSLHNHQSGLGPGHSLSPSPAPVAPPWYEMPLVLVLIAGLVATVAVVAYALARKGRAPPSG